jgi:hypothetical protein
VRSKSNHLRPLCDASPCIGVSLVENGPPFRKLPNLRHYRITTIPERGPAVLLLQTENPHDAARRYQRECQRAAKLRTKKVPEWRVVTLSIHDTELTAPPARLGYDARALNDAQRRKRDRELQRHVVRDCPAARHPIHTD